MAASTPHRVHCVYWSYLSDDRRYQPYSPDTSAYIELSHSQGHSYHSISGSPYEIDFGSCIQTNKNTGKIRPLQRNTIMLPVTPIMGIWEWEESPGKYVMYGLQASVEIELAYTNSQTTIDLSTTAAAIPYNIDLRKLHQTRHGYGTKRKIRHKPLVSPLQEYLKDHKAAVASMGHHGHTPLGHATIPATIGHPSIGPTSVVGTGAIHSSSSRGGTAGVVYMGISSTGGVNPTTQASGSSRSRSGHPSSISGTGVGSSGSSRMNTRSMSIPVSSSPPSFTNPATALINSKSAAPSKNKPLKTSKGKNGASATAVPPNKSPKLAAAKQSNNVNSVKKVTHEDGPFGKYVKLVSSLNFGEDEPCPICMSNLSEPSGFEDDSELPSTAAVSSSSPDICKLRRCGHMLHRACLVMYMKNSDSKSKGLTCPKCKKIHGVKTGDMPNGTMTHSIQRYSLPGHPGCDTIEITYNFRSGTYNGKRYYANGFPRHCYVPNSAKGQKVFKLLQVAWKRRLTFTIGTSVTTGATDTIVWNEIHHKTEAHGNSSGHGYPDDNYLDNVLAELSAQGVEEDQDESDDDGSCSDSDDDL